MVLTAYLSMNIEISSKTIARLHYLLANYGGTTDEVISRILDVFEEFERLKKRLEPGPRVFIDPHRLEKFMDAAKHSGMDLNKFIDHLLDFKPSLLCHIHRLGTQKNA